MKWGSVDPILPTLLCAWMLPPYTYGQASTGNTSNTTWPVANQAIYIPVELPHHVSLTTAWWFNPNLTQGGAVDVGVYDTEGNRIVSTGAITQVGSNTFQQISISAKLSAGLWYFAMSVSNLVGSYVFSGAAFDYMLTGVYTQASAHPLPNPATFVTGIIYQKLPRFGFCRSPRTTV
jgi:hypothetical protein